MLVLVEYLVSAAKTMPLCLSKSQTSISKGTHFHMNPKTGRGRFLPPCLEFIYLSIHFEHLASTQCYSSRSMQSNLAMLWNKGSGNTIVWVILGIPAFQCRPLCLLFFCAVMKTAHAGRKVTGPFALCFCDDVDIMLKEKGAGQSFICNNY